MKLSLTPVISLTQITCKLTTALRNMIKFVLGLTVSILK